MGQFLSTIFSTWASMFGWLRLRLLDVVQLFYSNGSLTFFGILAIVSLGISIFFLLIRVVQNFLHFRA